jgi:transposase InsO family protein
MGLARPVGASAQALRRTTIRILGIADAWSTATSPRPRRISSGGADIKHVRTWQGWLYLGAVMDCYSRRIVGCSMRLDLDAELVVDALEMRSRDVVPAGDSPLQSDCFDNAVAESFRIEAFYNPIRLHSALGYLSPIDYRRKMVREERAA